MLAFGQAKLDAVSAAKSGLGAKVSIAGSELSQPKEFSAFGGKSYILEFEANMVGRGRRFNVGYGGVEYVNYAWFSAKPPKIRVHVKLKSGDKPKLVQTDKGWDVVVGNTEVKPVAVATKPVVRPAVTPKIETKKPDVGPELTASTDPLFKPFEPGSPAPKQNSGAMTAPRTGITPDAGLVSLDFIATDVTQVLKALMMQAKVNIVTAPDIKGAITVSLDKVKLDEALDFVTALAGLRYAKVGKTYVVAPKEKFAEIMRTVTRAGELVSDTRLVPIFSGEPQQVKNAVLLAFPPDSGLGSFDILLPGDSVSAPSAEPKPKDDGEGGATAKEDTKPAAKSTGSGSALGNLYVLLVGETSLLDKVEKVIQQVDKSICSALGIAYSGQSSLVQETYMLQSDSMKAQDLIKVVQGLAGSAFRSVELYPAPTQSDRQAIVLVGRPNEVQRARQMLEEFDGAGDGFFVYDVKYSDPRALKDALVGQVPGLRVSLPPGSAANPLLHQPAKAGPGGQDAGATGGGGATAGGTAGGGGAQASGATVKGDQGQVSGLAQPFADFEKMAQPMKLVLRGTKAQIDKAMLYLAAVDLAPKQIALDLRVVEMSKEDALRLGLDWSIMTGGLVRTFRVNQGLGDTAASPGTISGSASNNAIGTSTGSILGTLDSIANDRKLIARPNLLAIDGRETELFVGDVVRYIESIQSTQNGISITVGTIRVGVRFAVLARAGADGKVMMDLRPVVSYLRAFTPVPGGGQLPQTSERVAQNTVLMNSGETIAIGGLIQDEDRKSVSGIPLLKDLPIIGRLFARTDNRKARTEIVFFMTMRVVEEADRKNAANPADKDRAEKEAAKAAKKPSK